MEEEWERCRQWTRPSGNNATKNHAEAVVWARGVSCLVNDRSRTRSPLCQQSIWVVHVGGKFFMMVRVFEAPPVSATSVATAKAGEELALSP